MRYAKGKPKGCKECHREKQRGRPYNPKRTRQYYEANKERLNAYRKAWRQVNRPRGVEYRSGGREAIEYAQLINGNPCVYCGAPGVEVDHILPVTRGGDSNWMNMAPACRSCNARKQNKDVLQYLLRRRTSPPPEAA
jgi:5-methylcytosine-specific restriction endonuclease McrA